MNPSAFSRWLVVPLSALVVFGIGYLLAMLVHLIWSGMPVWLFWGIPTFLLLWYLADAVRREKS